MASIDGRSESPPRLDGSSARRRPAARRSRAETTRGARRRWRRRVSSRSRWALPPTRPTSPRSEEHTSELQSQSNLVCRLLLEKKKKKQHTRVIVQRREHHCT